MIFDGLDELFDPALRETVTHRITAFSAQYPRARIVVTTRIVGYRRKFLDAAGFSHHMLQDLDRARIEEFVTTWHRRSCPGNPTEARRLSNRILSAVDESPAVAELAGNPMLLTILSIIGRRRELPRDRRAVYQHAVSVLVEHWEVNKHLHRKSADTVLPLLDHHDKLDLLRRVARRMQDAPAGLAGNYIQGTDLIEEFVSYLRDRYQLPDYESRPVARTMLTQFRERNFILSLFGAEVYGFVHRTLLEYLAAEDIVDRLNEREFTEDTLTTEVFGRHWRDPAWHEVLLMIIGMIKEKFAGQIIDYLIAADPLWSLRDSELPHHALLAIRCLGEIRRIGVLEATSIAVVDTVIALIEENNRQEGTREMAFARTLSRAVLPVFTALGPHWAGRARYQDWYLIRGRFLPYTERSFDSSRLLAARLGLVLFDGPADNGVTFQDLLHIEAQHPEPVNRQIAIQVLAEGWGEDPATVTLLRERAVSDKTASVRSTAIEVLAKLSHEDRSTVDLLRKRAVADKGCKGATERGGGAGTVERGSLDG